MPELALYVLTWRCDRTSTIFKPWLWRIWKKKTFPPWLDRKSFNDSIIFKRAYPLSTGLRGPLKKPDLTGVKSSFLTAQDLQTAYHQYLAPGSLLASHVQSTFVVSYYKNYSFCSFLDLLSIPPYKLQKL